MHYAAISAFRTNENFSFGNTLDPLHEIRLTLDEFLEFR